MAERAPDVIMAEYLLNGGKMLAKTCQVCGAPLFEYKGETKCVVCEERKKSPQGSSDLTEVQKTMQKEMEIQPVRGAVSDRIQEELTITILTLCQRVREEPEPERCLALVECLSTSIEALQRIRHP